MRKLNNEQIAGILTLAVVAFAVLIGASVLAVWYVSQQFNSLPPSPPTKPAPPTQRVVHLMSREKFTELVIGMTKQEVIEMFGKPSSTHNEGDPLDPNGYFYSEVTYNPVTKKPDSTFILFVNNSAVRVSFY